MLVGVMVEVPALLYELDKLLPKVDFVSVGSNDLLQYLFAADRNNERTAKRYDSLSVPALQALGGIVAAGRRHNKSVTLCGEMASRPLEAMALIGLGYRSISMAASAIGPVKAMLMELDAAALEKHLARLIEIGHTDIRAALKTFASVNAIDV
jgi:phosphotransferase system, enzyme I, PtsP